MSIKKKLGLGLVVGLLAMAFAALPAAASAAQPLLTSPSGTTVPVGTTVTATSTNAKTVFAGSAGTLSCEKVVINGVVEKDDATNGVEVVMDGANDTATGCTLLGAGVTVKPTFELLRLTETSKTAKFTFTVSTGLTESSTSTVTYTGPNATKIHVEGPVGGTNAGTFSGDFTAVVKSTGKSVLFD